MPAVPVCSIALCHLLTKVKYIEQQKCSRPRLSSRDKLEIFAAHQMPGKCLSAQRHLWKCVLPSNKSSRLHTIVYENWTAGSPRSCGRSVQRGAAHPHVQRGGWLVVLLFAIAFPAADPSGHFARIPADSATL